MKYELIYLNITYIYINICKHTDNDLVLVIEMQS